MRRDQLRHLLGRAALHRYQDDPRIGEGLAGFIRHRDILRRKQPLLAVEIHDLEASGADRIGDARPSEQADLSAGQRQATADIAADASGARDRDGRIDWEHSRTRLRRGITAYGGDTVNTAPMVLDHGLWRDRPG